MESIAYSEVTRRLVGSKMIVPMVLFILPPIFIIALGPSVVSLLTELPKMF